MIAVYVLGGDYEVISQVLIGLCALAILLDAAVIFYLIRKFIEGKTLLNSSFYKLFCVQRFLYVLFLSTTVAAEMGGSENPWIGGIGNIIQWYAQISSGGYYGAIAVNRCTAVAFSLRHESVNPLFTYFLYFCHPSI